MTKHSQKSTNDIDSTRRQLLAKSALGLGGLLLFSVFPGAAVSRAMAVSTGTLPSIITLVLDEKNISVGRFEGEVPIPTGP